MPECTMHLHGHRNKMVPLMMPFILANLSNGTKFRNYTYWSSNDIQNHCILRWASNHNIDNEDLVLPSHVEIDS
jgi:hypothetical protein